MTERLVIKPFEQSDRERLVYLLKNEEITRYFMVPDYKTDGEYYDLADKLIKFSSVDDEKHLEYGIFLNDRLIGFINDCGFDDDEIEIGYVIDPAYQKHGYATEATRAVIDELWGMGFNRITAGFFEGNTASCRVMEKCGMTLTDEVNEEEYRGRTFVCHCCEILRPQE